MKTIVLPLFVLATITFSTSSLPEHIRILKSVTQKDKTAKKKGKSPKEAKAKKAKIKKSKKHSKSFEGSDVYDSNATDNAIDDDGGFDFSTTDDATDDFEHNTSNIFGTDLYWYNLYARWYAHTGFTHMAATWEATFSYEDCPLITDWFKLEGDVNGDDAYAPGLVECKELCMEMNAEWSGDPMSTPPCTSISIDPLSNECVLRQCKIFPMIPPEFSIKHEDMAKVDPRYGGDRNRYGTLIRDYFLNLFDTDPTTGDSRCLPGETFRRIPPGKHDFHQTEGSFVCEYNGTIFDESNIPIPVPIDYFFEPEAPFFENCWQDGYGVPSGDRDDKYLTYWFAIEMQKDFRDHFYEFEEQFNEHGYYTVEESVNIVWDKARWIFQKQFNVDIRISRVVVQNNDDSYPEPAWRPGDAGLVRLSKARRGGTGVAQTCTPKDMHVGNHIFEHDRPGYFNGGLVRTIAHEMIHFLGQPHSTVTNPDIMEVEGRLTHRRCNKMKNPNDKRCGYRAFIPFNNVDDHFKYTTRFCQHLRSEQAKSCSMTTQLNEESPTYPPGQSDMCPITSTGGLFACLSDGAPCKYVAGGTDWSWADRAGCPDYASEGYAPVFRERDSNDDQHHSAYSEHVCRQAFQDMIDNFGIDIRIGSDVRITPGGEDQKDPIFSFHGFDRPTGCFIECIDGNLYGFFNHYAGGYLKNPGNSVSHPLCIQSTVNQCYASEEPLCPNDGTPCKYVTGGTNWGGGDSARCRDYESEGYAPVFRERDFDRSSIYSDYSEYACMRAIQDLIDNFDIDIRIGIRNVSGEQNRMDPIFKIYSLDRPAGCFIECVDKQLYGFFNNNAGNYISNRGNSRAHPLCIRERTTSQCSDSQETFVHNIESNKDEVRQNCTWVAQNPTERCEETEKENGEKLSNICPRTCDACRRGDYFWLRK